MRNIHYELALFGAILASSANAFTTITYYATGTGYSEYFDEYLQEFVTTPADIYATFFVPIDGEDACMIQVTCGYSGNTVWGRLDTDRIGGFINLNFNTPLNAFPISTTGFLGGDVSYFNPDISIYGTLTKLVIDVRTWDEEQEADLSVSFTDRQVAVPELSSWAMMIGGFAAIGAAMRRRRVRVAFS